MRGQFFWIVFSQGSEVSNLFRKLLQPIEWQFQNLPTSCQKNKANGKNILQKSLLMINVKTCYKLPPSSPDEKMFLATKSTGCHTDSSSPEPNRKSFTYIMRALALFLKCKRVIPGLSDSRIPKETPGTHCATALDEWDPSFQKPGTKSINALVCPESPGPSNSIIASIASFQYLFNQISESQPGQVQIICCVRLSTKCRVKLNLSASSVNDSTHFQLSCKWGL